MRNRPPAFLWRSRCSMSNAFAHPFAALVMDDVVEPSMGLPSGSPLRCLHLQRCVPAWFQRTSAGGPPGFGGRWCRTSWAAPGAAGGSSTPAPSGGRDRRPRLPPRWQAWRSRGGGRARGGGGGGLFERGHSQSGGCRIGRFGVGLGWD